MVIVGFKKKFGLSTAGEGDGADESTLPILEIRVSISVVTELAVSSIYNGDEGGVGLSVRKPPMVLARAAERGERNSFLVLEGKGWLAQAICSFRDRIEYQASAPIAVAEDTPCGSCSATFARR
jgi:hypothetical protein